LPSLFEHYSDNVAFILKRKKEKDKKARGIVQRNASKHIQDAVSLLTFEKRKYTSLFNQQSSPEFCYYVARFIK